MEMLEKFLIPVDALKWDNTLNAVKTAIRVSSGCKVGGEPELIFLHVFYVKPRISISERKRLIDMKKEKVEKEFETIREMCKEEGLEKVRTITKEGNPSKEIVKLAEEEDVDLAVIGSGKLHDRSTAGRLNKFFYGSVTEEVIHEAPCSVLVTRPEMMLRKFLVPVDSIEWDNTLMGVKNAIEFAGGCGGEGLELILMHVLHSPSGVSEDIREERLDLERKRVRDEFDRIKKMCEERGNIEVSTILKGGDPSKRKRIGDEIVETAEEEEVDMIAMGSGKLHDRSAKGRIQKFLYGSVTENVIHAAPCSVLVARPLA